MYIPHSVNGFGGVRWQPPSKQVSMAVIFISFIFCYKIVLMFYNGYGFAKARIRSTKVQLNHK